MISRCLSALIVVFLMHLNVSSAFANFAARNIYAPVGNTTVTGTNVQFTWEGGPAGAGWWLQVSDNPSFTPASSIILNTATNVYYYDARCIGPYSIGGSYYCTTISTTYAIPPNNAAHSLIRPPSVNRQKGARTILTRFFALNRCSSSRFRLVFLTTGIKTEKVLHQTLIEVHTAAGEA